MRSRILFVSILLALVALVQPAEAKSKKHHAHGMVVTSVDAAAKKIVITIEDGHQSMSYVVPAGTTITINEAPALLSEVHKGMHVVTYTEADEHVLSQLDVDASKG